MSFIDADKMHGALLHSVERPRRFDDWLSGAHYAKNYLPQLEQTIEAVKESLTIGQSAAPWRLSSSSLSETSSSSSSSSSLRHKERMLNKFAGNQSDKAANNAGKEVKGCSTQEMYNSVMNNAEQNLEETNEKNGADTMECKHANLPRCSRKRDGSKRKIGNYSEEKSKKSMSYKLMNKSDNNLDVLEVRNQLKASYFHMREADAFGDTFPPLLTPYNRPLLKYYSKEEWDSHLRELGTSKTSHECSKNTKQMHGKLNTCHNRLIRNAVHAQVFDANKTVAHFTDSMRYSGPRHFVTTLHCHLKKINHT